MNIHLKAKNLKAQADTAKKQYQKLDGTYEPDRIKKEKRTIKKQYIKSNLQQQIQFLWILQY